MENLVYERWRPDDSPKKNVIPMKEVPILSKEEKEKTLAEIREEKIKKSEIEIHWELIDPEKLDDADIYGYYRTFRDKLEPWDSDEYEDFKSYVQKTDNYLEETYGTTNEVGRKEDSRNNMRGMIRNCLAIRGLEKKRKEKNKNRTIQ